MDDLNACIEYWKKYFLHWIILKQSPLGSKLTSDSYVKCYQLISIIQGPADKAKLFIWTYAVQPRKIISPLYIHYDTG